MKKQIIILLVLVLLIPIRINAEEKGDIVKLSNCVDFQSARFIYGVNEIKVKFIGIQNEVTEDISLEFVNNYVCELFNNSKEIKIVYEPKLPLEDQFGRIQAWIFVDNVLLQEDLLKKGYAKILYLEDDFLYTEKLKQAQKEAKDGKIGIWVEPEKNDTKEEIKEEINEKKSKSIIDIIVDFFVDVFRKIKEFIDNIIDNIL